MALKILFILSILMIIRSVKTLSVKLNKICDEYELSDDTFFRTVFLYDLQWRVKSNGWESKWKLENKPLHDLFIFGEGEEGEKKWRQFNKFFEILSCLTISIKYYEHERMSPGLIHILKFFRLEKLNVKIKAELEELQEIDDMQQIILEIIYEFIWEKQTEIIYKVNWKMQIVTVKHFIDHFIRILPDFKKLHITNIKDNFGVIKSGVKLNGGVLSRKMIWLQELINEEIEDCIDSVSKLSPLVPQYIHYNCAEIATASVSIYELIFKEISLNKLPLNFLIQIIISLKHSLKSLQTETKCEKGDIEVMKTMYTKWVQSVYTKYKIDKVKILQFTVYLKDFLTKVWD